MWSAISEAFGLARHIHLIRAKTYPSHLIFLKNENMAH
jgi:hypothetical protein